MKYNQSPGLALIWTISDPSKPVQYGLVIKIPDIYIPEASHVTTAALKPMFKVFMFLCFPISILNNVAFPGFASLCLVEMQKERLHPHSSSFSLNFMFIYCPFLQLFWLVTVGEKHRMCSDALMPPTANIFYLHRSQVPLCFIFLSWFFVFLYSYIVFPFRLV